MPLVLQQSIISTASPLTSSELSFSLVMAADRKVAICSRVIISFIGRKHEICLKGISPSPCQRSASRWDASRRESHHHAPKQAAAASSMAIQTSSRMLCCLLICFFLFCSMDDPYDALASRTMEPFLMGALLVVMT